MARSKKPGRLQGRRVCAALPLHVHHSTAIYVPVTLLLVRRQIPLLRLLEHRFAAVKLPLLVHHRVQRQLPALQRVARTP